MHVSGIEYVELFVGNVDKAAGDLHDSYGFVPDDEAGHPHHDAETESCCMRAGDARFILTASDQPSHPAHRYVRRHGDGIANIALSTPDAAAAFERAVAHGARPVKEPESRACADGTTVIEAAVSGFGDVDHVLVEHRPASGTVPLHPEGHPCDGDCGVRAVDHFAICLPAGQLKPTTRFYLDAMGFELLYEEEIVLGNQGMNSQVVRNGDGSVTFTLIEPAYDRAPGQIDGFLRSHGGAGVQHVAFLTCDILQSVRECERHGVRFLSTPASYYARMAGRFEELKGCMDLFKRSNVLMDRDDAGYMFQIFTSSTHERHTLFFELIQREGGRTFGSANIKALYESVERELTQPAPLLD